MELNLATEQEELFYQAAAGVSAGKLLFLYGTGNGADKVLNRCSRLGIPVHGVFASNEFMRGQTFRGFQVQSLDWTLANWGSPQKRKRAIVLACFGSEDPQVLERSRLLEEYFDFYVPDLALFGEDRPILSFGRRALEEGCLLYEPESRQRFEDLINYKITGRLEYLRRTWSSKEALYSFLALGSRQPEIYVDAGAYDGDTIREVRSYLQRKAVPPEASCQQLSWGSLPLDPPARLKVLAIEPDPKNRRKLEAYKETVWDKEEKPADLKILPYALSDRPARLSFDNAAGRNSALSEKGRLLVEARPLDQLTQEATLVKMDVEGAEAPALQGAKGLLARCKPRLILSAYHRSGDILTLARLIRQLNPQYRLSLHQSPYFPAWDTNILGW